ncbi:hypothetical protein IE53DRAFT_251667 [Violaceomyces palustris]|uniref:Uncharacterized protein n=1 Tax=Violaceomyces palustris TaxID=1673888 RepID=A0ACD0NNQ8_9BASI|nr:hypothetical protein IE53DRAFT_251667 [Violaceomyces palustris]
MQAKSSEGIRRGGEASGKGKRTGFAPYPTLRSRSCFRFSCDPVDSAKSSHTWVWEGALLMHFSLSLRFISVEPIWLCSLSSPTPPSSSLPSVLCHGSFRVDLIAAKGSGVEKARSVGRGQATHLSTKPRNTHELEDPFHQSEWMTTVKYDG